MSRRQMCATIRLSVTSASAAVIVGGIIVRIGTAPAYSRLTERHAAEATCIIQRAQAWEHTQGWQGAPSTDSKSQYAAGTMRG